MRFRKKPIEIEARQFLPEKHVWEPSIVLARWCGGDFYPGSGRNPRLVIRTMEGAMRAEPGDWIIRGVQGEFYPCKPDIFEATYERIDAVFCRCSGYAPAVESRDEEAGDD